MTTRLQEKEKQIQAELDILKLKNTEKKIISRLVTGYYEQTKQLAQVKIKTIVANFPLAVHMAKKYIRNGSDIEDLIQVAAIGLVKGVKKYNPKMKVKFSTYVIPTIEGELKHYMRDNFYCIRLSRKYVELNAKIQKYKEEFLYKNGREATVEEIAKSLKMRTQAIISITDAVRTHSVLSLETPIGAYGKDDRQLAKLEDLLGRESKAEAIIEQETMKEAFAQLDKRERTIVKDHFIRELGQEELASRYGITQAQISRIIKAACSKLSVAMM